MWGNEYWILKKIGRGEGVKYCLLLFVFKLGFMLYIFNSKYDYNNNGGFGFLFGLLIVGFDNLIWFLVYVFLKLL